MAFKIRDQLEKHRVDHPVGWSLLEQDYALSWMLYGLMTIPKLREHLIFKGGTCLKKCYFGDYRFSQDLDFSVQGQCPVGHELESLINRACQEVIRILQASKNNVTFTCTRYVEKRPHPENQEAFVIAVQYPWQREVLTRIMVEITLSEIVYLPIQMRPLIHGYGDEINAQMPTYALEEVMAEKIAALVSVSKKLHERGWSRSRARDYYDLWRILTDYNDQIQPDLIFDLATKKCTRKSLVFRGFEDIFAENLMLDLEGAWLQWVKPLVVNLPDKNRVLEDLKNVLSQSSENIIKRTSTHFLQRFDLFHSF